MQAKITSRLTQTFQNIAAARMRGLPVMNDSLRVEAVGFTPWSDNLVGVLIAPWFMNLILLPGQDKNWRGLEEGSKAVWTLPAGDYEFTVARLNPVGVYQSCVLFSSVLDFPDQDTARLVARTIMSDLFAEQTGSGEYTGGPLRDDLRRGLSRRDLLRLPLGR